MAGGAVSWFDDEPVIAGSLGAAAIEIAPFAVTAFGVGVAESVTFSVRLAAAPETSAVGVPVIAPVAVLSDKPFERAGEIDTDVAFATLGDIETVFPAVYEKGDPEIEIVGAA